MIDAKNLFAIYLPINSLNDITFSHKLNLKIIVSMLLNIFIISLLGFVTLYVLRGIGMITFISGGVITILLMTMIISGLTWGILKTRRY
ncbi:MAG: hypothetical protein RLZZ535_942 [Cyanobacteriota bacterium]|jgi:hypothetical protein